MKAIEVVEFDSEKVVKTIDVSGQSERKVEKMERGLNINLNHDKYYTRII